MRRKEHLTPNCKWPQNKYFHKFPKAFLANEKAQFSLWWWLGDFHHHHHHHYRSSLLYPINDMAVLICLGCAECAPSNSKQMKTNTKMRFWQATAANLVQGGTHLWTKHFQDTHIPMLSAIVCVLMYERRSHENRRRRPCEWRNVLLYSL